MSDFSKKSFPVIKDGRFYNDHEDKPRGFLLHSLGMYLYSKYRRMFSRPENIKEWYAPEKHPDTSIDPRITWIGHATFLIQVGGLNVLTDPIFGDQSFLFKRILPPGIELDQLVDIDVVIISHNHFDHMEYKSLAYLKRFKPMFFVPKGLKDWFDSYGFERVYEMNWWDEHVIQPTDSHNSLQLAFLPARHWSQRGIFDRNKSLWGSWLIKCNNESIYFAGDTSYGTHFAQIGQAFSPSIALIPIGPCEPKKLMIHSHLDATEACKAFLELQAKHFIPMHWGTFYFGIDRFITPVEYLRSHWHANKTLASKKLTVPKIGQSVLF